MPIKSPNAYPNWKYWRICISHLQCLRCQDCWEERTGSSRAILEMQSMRLWFLHDMCQIAWSKAREERRWNQRWERRKACREGQGNQGRRSGRSGTERAKGDAKDAIGDARVHEDCRFASERSKWSTQKGEVQGVNEAPSPVYRAQADSSPCGAI